MNLYCADSGNDHDVKRKSADPVEQERISILVFDNLFLSQQVKNSFYNNCAEHAEDKIESINGSGQITPFSQNHVA